MGPIKDFEDVTEPDEVKELEAREIIIDIEDFADGFIPIGSSAPSHEIVEDADPSSPIVSALAIVTDDTVKPRILRQHTMYYE